MKISDTSIRNPVFAWMLMIGLILFGAICFSRMGVSQMPDVDFPVLTVQVTLEGAAPEVMESTVVDPIEDAVMAVEGLQSITSNAKTGSASITLEFELNRDINVALQEVQSKVAQAQRRLPTDIDPPVITKTNPEDQPIIWLALTYDKVKDGNDQENLLYMMKYANEHLKDRLTTVPGVGEIFLGGYIAPALRVWVDEKKLTGRNMAVSDIINAIETEHAETPGGLIEEQRSAFNVRTIGEAKTAEEFSSIAISQRAGRQNVDPSRMVQMSQIARVEEGLDEVRRLSRFNKVPALGLGVRKQRGANAVAVAKAVKARAEELGKDLPKGMKLQVNFDSTRFIETSIRELNTHLILAVILTAFVCLSFLGSWSATLNVLLSIPTSIMGAFIGMYALGYTLNTFTLLGLTLAIGIVVDDAIMVLENIFRYQEMKKGRIVSAIIGTREIAFAALAATLAVIAIFLPVAFMKGIIGKYFMQFGVTISLAVLLSLLEALTITPMRASAFVGSNKRTSWFGRGFEAMMTWMEHVYSRILGGFLRWPKTVVVASLVFMVASFYMVKFVPKEFMPAADQSLFMARIQTPVGSSLAYTDEQAKIVEDWMLKQPEVKQVYVAIGGFGGGGSEGNTANMFVTLIPKKERNISQLEFMAKARKGLSGIKDLKVSMQDPSARGFSTGRGFPVEFKVTGGDWEKLWESTRQLMDEMEKSGLMVDVDSNYLLGMPEIQIKPERVRATMHGVSVQTIGKTINSLIGGVRVGQYQVDGRRYDIRLQMEKTEKKPEIKSLLIGNSFGNLIPLSQVVDVENRKSLQQISRVDRQRAITVFANVAPGHSQQAALDYVQKKSDEILPEGYAMSNQGSSATMAKSFTSLLFALVLGLAVAYMVLAAQFNSFIDPVTILMALPFAISGALFALMASFQSINIYSMIGILLLMGIVKKNSIMLVEFTNQKRETGFDTAIAALKEACPIRLRPILMTSIATVAAAVPSALATGEGSETFKPMAITIIGGVTLSTVLTLLVIPCVYLLFDRFRKSEKSNEEIRKAFESLGEFTPSLHGEVGGHGKSQRKDAEGQAPSA